MKKALVAYFSASGRTAKAANDLASAIAADIHEIKPAVPYTRADLNWLNRRSRSSEEMKDTACRPEILQSDIDLSAYDTVFLGFPIWWYTAPMIIRTFLESHDFTGKRVILFATSGSSGLGNTRADLLPSAPTAEFIEGRILKTGESPDRLKVWAESVL